MAGISSSIKLTDQATGPLLSMANAANATANAFTRVLSACDSIMNTGGISELEKKTTQVGQKTDENTRKQEEYNQKAERRRSGCQWTPTEAGARCGYVPDNTGNCKGDSAVR